MESDESSQQTNDSNDNTLCNRQVWSFMNTTIITLLSNIGGSKSTIAEDTSFYALFDLLLSKKNELDILAPRIINNFVSKNVQQSYTAFTTWLFGVMVYLTNLLINNTNNTLLKKAIEVQVLMVRFLSRLNVEIHEKITSEYLDILGELMLFNDETKDTKEIKLIKFQADQNALDYLNLTPLTVIVEHEDIVLFQDSILKIIIETDVSVWPQKRLKKEVFDILVYSQPKTKITALKVGVEMFNSYLLNDNDIQKIMLYATEIVKSLFEWKRKGLILLGALQENSSIFEQLVTFVDDPTYINFYFEIFATLANHTLRSDKLETEICNKIEYHMNQFSCSDVNTEVNKFFSYFDKAIDFKKIITSFIMYEFESQRFDDPSIDLSQISKVWATLKKFMSRNLEMEKYKETLKLLQLANWIDFRFSHKNITVNLLDTDVRSIQSAFLKGLDSNNYRQNKLIFECFSQLISLREINKDQIQSILMLPWLDISLIPPGVTKTHLANAKSLDFATKVKCVNSLSRYGKGKQRIEILNMCLSSCEIELGVSSVLNCSMLLLDNTVNFNDIVEQILIPAYNTQKVGFHDVLSNILGQLACIISGDGIITRDSTDFELWKVVCKCCDNLQTQKGSPSKISLKHEALMLPFFELLNSASNKVRLNMSKNLLRFSNHVKCFNSNSLARKWILYVEDDNDEIRKNFSDAIGLILTNRIDSSLPNKLFQDDIPPSLTEFINIIMNKLITVLNEILTNYNQSLHQSLLMTAKNAACIQSNLTERRALNIFILTIVHVKSSPLAIALATDAFGEVAIYHKVSAKMMYTRYKKDFMRLMMTIAVHNRINYDYNMSTTIHRVAKCLGFQGSRQLLRRDGHHAVSFLLPQIIKFRKAITLFHDIAELTNSAEKDMFKAYFKHICCQVFLFENIEDGVQIFKLVSDITETSIPVMTAHEFSFIVTEMMLHFHSQKEKVLKHLEFLSKYDSQQNPNFKTQDGMVQYLNVILHAILVHIDQNLNPNNEEIIQQYALASLAEIIRFMGPNYITQYRYKILATLRTALTFTRPGFRKLACDAWDAFIRNTTFKELGPLLATICMSLVPLFETYAKETNSILDYLLIKNKDALKEHLSDLFFINDLKISPNISTRVISHMKQIRPISIEENLRLWIQRIVHETDEVRLKALLYLQQYLSKNRDGINVLILSDVNVHPLIVELLDRLMAGCQDKDDAIRIASGDCIGELGAIEPSLLPRRIISRGDTKFIPDINHEFAYALFCELVKDYQSQKSTQSMDCFSLAIQEILKAYGISPGGRNCKIWNELPSKIKHMIFPLLSSHYRNMTVDNEIPISSPIYGSELGSSFEMWAANWIITMIRGIKDPVISCVLNACRPAFKRNVKLITFCIPYLVSYIVINGSLTDIRKLTAEMLAVIAIQERSQIDRELSRYRPLRVTFDVQSNSERVSDEARRVRCLQIIFSTFDHLQRWLREKRKSQDEAYKKIEKFCDGFPKLLLAEGCYQSYEYHRALIYLEEHMTVSKKGLSESREAGLLAKIYTQLEEPDGVSGILISQDQSPTLQQLVLAHEVNGQFQDAATCYEKLLQNAGRNPKYLHGMIQCHLGLNQPFTALNLTKGVSDNRPELETLICDSEPFWQLAHFGKIESDSKKNIKFNLLQDLKNRIKPNILSIKKKLVSLLTASSRPGAYEQSYSYIIKLHVVNEFEKACSLMLEDSENLPMIFDEWEKRDKLINASRGAEFICGMRTAILDLAVQLQVNSKPEKIIIKEEIGKLWLKSAKNARKAGLYQQAYMYILYATDFCAPQELCIEQAKLYWQKGSHEEALITLKRCLATYFKSSAEYKKMPPLTVTTEREQCAKAKLLWAKYNDETLNVDANGNMTNYKEAFEVWRLWEKSCLAIARYYESVIDKMSDEERMSSSGRELQTHIINYYGKSLTCGCKYVHQSLPRMITVWLNYASRARTHSASDNGIAKTLGQMTKIVEVYIEKVPLFMWLTAFSQLVSRICHPNREVQNTLFTIIVKLIRSYPQHCLWMMASVFNSSYSARQKCCKEILNRDALKTTEMIKLIHCFHKFWERLIELSNKHIPEGLQTTTVNVLSKSLPRLLADSDFGPIMIPTSKFRQLHLPMKGANMDQHNPFAPNWVSIIGIEEQVAVMPSLQRPRRIALRGSDGNCYLFMCKPKDDLRRDFRLMEFNDIVNKYLQKDPESRRRRLYIRTYSVVPLNEECGLIEWVPNLMGYRVIIMNTYKERNMATGMKQVKAWTCALKDPLEKKRQVFLQKLLPCHPPIFGDWFHYAFPDPYGWYEARTAYIRTTAVMSMVGYILGLGDRHGENILIDSKCGDCVHVDFNCLFNRGETLEWPERVPFRLTHNMVEAMGPLKYEGPFRQSCRTTMKVLREQASTLISVLKPFVYDPLVSWNRNPLSDAGEKTNEKAVEHIKSIEDRLKGMVGTRGKRLEALTLYLSVEGQVNHLILDAINIDNLCQMYVGWGAYL
ncbi:serine/threonine-protein kinase ATR-like [Phymastichus coffea]|uniref:serine/threonine-protein kinase ATR-like n=1 Tax=Phymastichus coffea TaxID=108790 RepID=UPI00273A8F51|nr:serine/threonine-protein kinase ATR-like [Phymastichus coffea]